MAVQADGKIVLSGLFLPHGAWVHWEFAVARYTPNGVLDTTFGSGGEVIVDVGESLTPDWRDGSRHMDMALSGDHIDLVGNGYTSWSMYVVQLTAAGQLDQSFGVGGVVKGATCSDVSLADQSAGKVVVVSTLGVTRFLANGSLDTTFGTGGTVTWPPLRYYIPFAIKVDPLGRFVIGGWQQNATGIAFNVIRLTSAGAMDSSFGVGGIGTSGNLVNLDSNYGEVSMALQPDGKTILVSHTL